MWTDQLSMSRDCPPCPSKPPQRAKPSFVPAEGGRGIKVLAQSPRAGMEGEPTTSRQLWSPESGVSQDRRGQPSWRPSYSDTFPVSSCAQHPRGGQPHDHKFIFQRLWLWGLLGDCLVEGKGPLVLLSRDRDTISSVSIVPEL